MTYKQDKKINWKNEKFDYGILNEVVQKALKEQKDKYNELIMAVSNKYINETRHQTALRYIKQEEILSSEDKDNTKELK